MPRGLHARLCHASLVSYPVWNQRHRGHGREFRQVFL